VISANHYQKPEAEKPKALENSSSEEINKEENI
jgi:hypothetical protein